MGLERHAGKVNNDKNVILGWSNPLKPHNVIKLSISSEPLKLPNEGIQYVALMKGGGGNRLNSKNKNDQKAHFIF